MDHETQLIETNCWTKIYDNYLLHGTIFPVLIYLPENVPKTRTLLTFDKLANTH